VTLLASVLDTLLREDFQGIRTRSSVVDGTLHVDYAGHTLAIPVRPDGFLCDVAVSAPELTRDGTRLTELDPILALLREGVPAGDLDGFDAFVTECRDAQATQRLQRDKRTTTGPLRYDVLAAYLGHPVYPTGLARRGISPADQSRYAPEYGPTFRLRWAAVRASAVTAAGTLPCWWPTADELGMSADLVPFPVHPLTARHRLAVADAVDVTPTLSMRTVAVLADPGTHVKLPLPTSTLGLRNRRTMKPGTLLDGAVTGRLLAAALAAEPRFTDRIVLADEQTYAHADDELLAFLVRRVPLGAIPLAALPAPTGTGLVVDELGDRVAVVTEYLSLLLDFQVTLLLRYGMALESHQQNVSLLPGSTLRLLVKDNDGPRLHPRRLWRGLGDWPPGGDPALLDDRRIVVDSFAPLVDLFTTITLHLCAAAIVFALGGIDRRLIRDLLCAAIDRHPDSPDRRRLIDRTLLADRLPVKAMLTAGTLLSKQRSGAADVNKFYSYTGPNYLRSV
jgi:siderophore synthetase component